MSAFTLSTNKVFSPEAAPHGALQGALSLLHSWQKRAQERHELAQLTGRDARDMGLTEAQIEFEANKPFWRV